MTPSSCIIVLINLDVHMKRQLSTYYVSLYTKLTLWSLPRRRLKQAHNQPSDDGGVVFLKLWTPSRPFLSPPPFPSRPIPFPSLPFLPVSLSLPLPFPLGSRALPLLYSLNSLPSTPLEVGPLKSSNRRSGGAL